MGKTDIKKVRGVAFQVLQQTEHLTSSPYTFEVTLRPSKVFRGACTETEHTHVEIHDVGEVRCLGQYSHMSVVQNDTLIGSSQISRTASKISISLSTTALKKNSAFQFVIILKSRNSTDEFCQSPPHCPIAIYSPWKATAAGSSWQSTLAPTAARTKPALSFKPSPSPKASTSRRFVSGPKPAPSAPHPRVDLELSPRNTVSSTAVSAKSKVQTHRNAPQEIVSQSPDFRQEHGSETAESTLVDNDILASGTAVGPPYDVHFYHADQNPARSRGIAAHREVLSAFPKLKALVSNADIGRSIMRGKQEWNHLESSQAGRQTPIVVDISHFSYDAFRALVVYVYTSDFDLALSYVTKFQPSSQQSPSRWISLRHEGAGDQYLDLYELRELLLICGMFDMDALRYACIGTTLSSLTSENAVFMLVHLGRDVEEIRSSVLVFIKDNVEAIAGTCRSVEDLFKEYENQDCGDLLDELKDELRRIE
ncbi:hypothetical protein BGZ72_002686 [Mortierella alpina]|nr:hypothetical protein BGZ72_002686 [Mortierella alpina]